MSKVTHLWHLICYNISSKSRRDIYIYIYTPQDTGAADNASLLKSYAHVLSSPTRLLSLITFYKGFITYNEKKKVSGVDKWNDGPGIRAVSWLVKTSFVKEQ